MEFPDCVLGPRHQSRSGWPQEEQEKAELKKYVDEMMRCVGLRSHELSTNSSKALECPMEAIQQFKSWQRSFEL